MLSFYRDKIERTDINVCILGQSTTEGGSRQFAPSDLRTLYSRQAAPAVELRCLYLRQRRPLQYNRNDMVLRRTVTPADR